MKFAGKHVNDQIGKLLHDAVDRGWIFEGITHKGHFKIRHPNSNQVQICGDSGDPAAYYNIRARIKRAERQFGDLTKSKLAEQLQKIVVPELRLATVKAEEEKVEEKVQAEVHVEEPKIPQGPKDHVMTAETIEDAIDRMEKMDQTTRDFCRAVVLYAIGGTPQSSIGPLLGRSVSWYSAHVKPKILDLKIPFFTDDDLIATASSGQRGIKPAPVVSGDALRFSKAWVDRFMGQYRNQPIEPKPKVEPKKVEPKVESSMFEAAHVTRALRDAKDAYVAALAGLESAIQSARSAGMELEVVGLPASAPRILIKTVRDI